MVEFNDKSKPKLNKLRKKINSFGSANTPYEGLELTINTFKKGIFPIKETQGKGLKILTPKQMLQRSQ